MEFQKFEDRIYLASPRIHGEERQYVQEAFDTNWMSTVGENLDCLEEGIRDYLKSKASVALSSGTAALHLAVKLAGIKQGDIVMCSDMTFAATVNPVSYEKGVQVFIDCEKDTWNMSPQALKKAMQKYRAGEKDSKVKAVIMANLYGTPGKLDEIADICEEYGVILIEDAAESLSATYKGRQTGTFGKYNVISFNGNKIITGTSGGMLLSDDPDAIAKAKKWSTQARENAPWYQHTELGYNYRLSNVLAGIARGQFLHLEEHRLRKKEIYERYKEGLKGLPITMNPYLKESEPNFWLSCLTVDPDAMCEQIRGEDGSCAYRSVPGKSCPDEIRETLLRYNVESRPIWKPMHMMPYYAECEFVADGEIVDEDIFARGLCLPSDINMTKPQQETVIEMIKSCFA